MVRRSSGVLGSRARQRLAAASAAAEAAPHKKIGVRAKEALTVLLASKQCSQVRIEGNAFMMRPV
jgi:hypothetical protein